MLIFGKAEYESELLLKRCGRCVKDMEWKGYDEREDKEGWLKVGQD